MRRGLVEFLLLQRRTVHRSVRYQKLLALKKVGWLAARFDSSHRHRHLASCQSLWFVSMMQKGYMEHWRLYWDEGLQIYLLARIRHKHHPLPSLLALTELTWLKYLHKPQSAALAIPTIDIDANTTGRHGVQHGEILIRIVWQDAVCRALHCLLRHGIHIRQVVVCVQPQRQYIERHCASVCMRIG